MSLSKYESTIDKQQDWLKIAAAIDEIVRECLLPLLHREGPYQALVYTGLPRDKKALFTLLSDATHQKVINDLIQKNILGPEQLRVLLPTNSETDSSKFDITLIVILFRNFNGLKTLNGQWIERCLDPTDTTLASLVVKVLSLRNRLFHWGNMATMTAADSNKFWTDVVNVAHRLQYAGDINRFKTISLDPDSVLSYKLLYHKLQHSCDQQQKELSDLKADQEIGYDYLKAGYDELRADHETLRNVQDNVMNEHHHLMTDHERLSKHIEDNEYQFSKIEIIEEKLDDVSQKQFVNKEYTQHYVASMADEYGKHMVASPEVLQLVSSMIGKDWKRLAICLALNLPLITVHRSNEKNMLKCFEERSNMIWQELKHGLKNIGRSDIIQNISEKFNLHDDNIHCREFKTNKLWYTIQSHASVEISDVNQQSKMKVLSNNDKISYISSGCSKNTITLEDWNKRCNDYYHRYFSQQNKVIFPPAINQESTVDRIASKIGKSQDGQFYLFTRYDIINQVKMHLGNTEIYHKVLNDLLIVSDEELQCSENRMLLFNTESKLLLNIRLTEGTDMNAIHKEEIHGISDLKLILYLFKRQIECSGITLANLVISPNISLDDGDEYCKQCLIIDQNIFNGEHRAFVEWWENHITSKFKPIEDSNYSDDLIKIISAVFGFMSTRQVNVNYSSSFPKFRTDNTCKGDEHQEILNLILTYNQHRAITHPVLKKMVFGGFGAGKSIVGEYQLKELAKQEANSRNHTFYICWDDNSLLYLQMQKTIQNIIQCSLNQRCYCFNRRDLVQYFLGLSKIPRLSELFQMIKRKCGDDKVHIIIDEFDQENLDNHEAEKLDAMFKTEEWKPSLVLFLPQSLEKKRQIIFGEDKDLKVVNTAYKCISEMVCFTLDDHMRSTISNYQFTKIATDIITSKVKNYIQHIENASIEEKETDMQRNILNGTSILATTETSVDVRPNESTRTNNSQEEQNSRRRKLSIEVINEDEVTFQVQVPLDELQSFDAPPYDSNRTESTYSCRKSENIGHNIVGETPQFINFKEKVNQNVDCTCMLAIAIQNKLRLHTECERLFICKTKANFLLITNILLLLKVEFINYHPISGYKFVDEKENILTELPKNFTLITDNKGSRGLQAAQVTIFIGSEDINEQQCFLETITRSTSELFIICPHQFNTSFMPPILNQIMQTSIEKRIARECIIKEFHLDDTDVVARYGRIDGNEYFCINLESGEYKQMCLMVEQLTPVDVSENITTVSPFDAPQGLKCNIIVSSPVVDKDLINPTCKLAWTDGPYDYVVKIKKREANNYEYTSKPISDSKYTFAYKDLIEGEDYIFSVATVSSLGESIPAQLPWRHVELFQMIQDNNLDVLKQIIQMFPWRFHDEDVHGWSLCHQAAYCKRPDTLDYLLHVDTNYVNKCDLDNDTPLHVAACVGSIDCVKLLLKHGANPMMKDDEGDTPIDIVCGWDDVETYIREIVTVLIEHMSK